MRAFGIAFARDSPLSAGEMADVGLALAVLYCGGRHISPKRTNHSRTNPL